MSGHLQLQKLSRRFGTTVALDSLSLDIEAGRITTLLGPSGCGKTTALRIIAGFLEADSGQVLLDGRSLAGLPPFRRDTAMVFQDFALFPHLSVQQNVGYGLRFRRLSAAEVRERVGSLLEFLQLDRLAGRLPHELSGGQQQRVALGRALAVRPRVLLMDEPLSNLDARLRSSVRNELRNIQRELGLTTVFVTHDQTEALSLSDAIVVMNQGQALEAGSPRQLFNLPRSRFTAWVLGDANFLNIDSVSGSGDGLRVTLAGQQLAVRSATGQAPVKPLLMIRPDDIGIDTDRSAGDLELPATLSSLEFHGSLERCRLQVPGLDTELQADLPAGRPVPAPGSAVRLVVPAGAAVLVEE